MQYTIQTQNVNSLSSSLLKKFVLFKLDFLAGKTENTERVAKTGKYMLYVIQCCGHSKCTECLP